MVRNLNKIISNVDWIVKSLLDNSRREEIVIVFRMIPIKISELG